MNETAIVPINESDRHDWLALVKNTIIKDANLTDPELGLIAAVCNALDADPFRGEIAFFRDGSALRWTQTVDGYLRKAAQTANFDGIGDRLWCGEDGVWKDLWISAQPPYAARVTVYSKALSRPMTYTAKWDTFARKNRDGALRFDWAQMPDLKLAAVALRQALRLAFPEAFLRERQAIAALQSEGIYVDVETGEIMDDQPPQLDEPKPISEVKPPTAATPKQTAQSAATRFWKVARARGSAWYEPLLQEHFGATSFELLDPDEQLRAAELLEAEAQK